MASFDEVIPPGKAGSIKASVHTANYKGPIGKTVTVTHDDKSQGPIALSVNAKIVGSVEVLPYPALQLGRHQRGFETPAKLIVRRDVTEQGKLAVEGLVSSTTWLKVSARDVTADEPPGEGIPAAKAGDVVLSVQAEGAPVGTHVETVKFKTGLSREPQVSIPVTINVQPPVTLQPNNLILNPAPERPEGLSGQVLVSVRDDLDPKKVTVTADAKAFTVRTDPPGARAFRLIVDWTGKGKKPPTESTVHIRIGAETVDLPVRVNPGRAGTAS